MLATLTLALRLRLEAPAAFDGVDVELLPVQPATNKETTISKRTAIAATVFDCIYLCKTHKLA